MPGRAAATRSVMKAFRMIKRKDSQGVEGSEDYRFYAKKVVKEVLEDRMNRVID